MRILITGAAGMLGQDLVSVLTPQHEVLGLDHVSCDITDEQALRRVFSEARPELVINCAAYPDVDGCERDPKRASTVNGRGAGNVARAAEGVGARVFHISTDYVFDGCKRTPYREDDPTNPISVYGHSKLEGERQVLGSNGAGARHLVLRTSWLYGIHKANFVEKTLTDAESRERLEVVSDQISCPTWTFHLAQKISELAERRVAGILHVANSGECSRYEMTCYTVEKLPRPIPVVPITWAQLHRPAKRPAYSVLGSPGLEKLGLAPLPNWKESLDEYLRVRQTATVGMKG